MHSMKRIAFIAGHMYGLNGAVGAPLGIVGPPGCGKTTMIREFAKRYLDGVCVVEEVSRMTGTDLSVPIPDHTRKRLDHYTSGKLADLAERPRGMLFADELTRPNDQSSLAAMLNLFLERQIGETDLRHIHVWAAWNPGEMVGGVDLDPAMMNRFIVVNWPDEGTDVESYANHMNRVDATSGKTDAQDWPAPSYDWRERWNDAWEVANRKVLAFLRTQPSMLTEDPPSTPRPWRSRRSWHLATNVLAACAIHGATFEEHKILLGGTVGEETAFAFLAWTKANDLPDPWKVLDGSFDLGTLKTEADTFIALAAAVDVWCATKRDDKRLDANTFKAVIGKVADRHTEIAAVQLKRLWTGGGLASPDGTRQIDSVWAPLVARFADLTKA